LRSARAGLLAVAVAVASPAASQTVPEVRDVYSSNRPSSRLGPAGTAQRVADEADAVLERTRTLRYEARAGRLGGTVLLGKGDDGSFDRFRVTLHGLGPAGESVVQVVGSDGRDLFVVDLLAKTVQRGADWEELGSAALARDLLLPELAPDDGEDGHLFKFPSEETVGGQVCYVVHFPDEERGDHVYVALSIDDGLPRRVDRVRTGPGGRPVTVTLDVSAIEIDPPATMDDFEPNAPEGFRRVEL